MPLVPDDEAEPIEAQSRWTESLINITGQGLSTSATRTAGYQIATSWGSYPRRAAGNMASPAQPVSERPSGQETMGTTARTAAAATARTSWTAQFLRGGTSHRQAMATVARTTPVATCTHAQVHM